MLEIIKKDLPNFPDEIINVWLQPYAESDGWPPDMNTIRWTAVLFGKNVDFWKRVTWKKEIVNLREVSYCPQTIYTIQEMKAAYELGVKNSFKDLYEESGKQRHLNVLRFLCTNGHFPKPICLLRQNDNKYSVVDGYHRLVAWTTHFKLQNILSTNPNKLILNDFMETVRNKWGIDRLVPFSENQEVWVAYKNQ